MYRTEQVMGMPVSIEVRGLEDGAVLDNSFNRLHAIDERFSTYRPDSEVSQLQRGDIRLTAGSEELRQVAALCEQYESDTEGYFSAFYKRQFDPTGLVKGWAIRQVAFLLKCQGYGTFSINAGGDILLASDNDHVWRIGLQHPHDMQKIVGVVQARNLAIATSGRYVRGNHLFDPHTKRPVQGVASVTVIGPDIVAADVYATALYVMGDKGLPFLLQKPGYEALVIHEDLRAEMSPGFAQLAG